MNRSLYCATGKYISEAARAFARLCSLLLGLCLGIGSLSVAADDARQLFTGESHPWLRAVGKLQVPGQRHRDGHTSHYLEDCSATLVTRRDTSQADTIVTAWHCLELYRDLSRPITFTVIGASGDPISREARRLADGGGMHADWALLRLREAIPTGELPGLTVKQEPPDPARPVTMAGYSRDDGLGQRGSVLTFDPACNIISQRRTLGATNCMAHKGASGGAVIQLAGDGRPFLFGVISEGNGQGLSTFVPVASFSQTLTQHLR